MLQKYGKTIQKMLAVIFAALAIVVSLRLIATIFQLPFLSEILSQPITIHVSMVTLVAFVIMILLFVINLLYTSNLQQKKEEQVEQSKNVLISLVSHQLRTPLSAVNWLTESLLSDDLGQVNKQQKEYIANIRESNKRMISMVNSILNISQIELDTFSFTFKPVNIVTLVDQLVSELDFHVQKKLITVKKQYGTNLDNVLTDERYLRIIIENLLLNAIKYSPEKSTVTIDINNKQGKLFIIVSDQGFGIPKIDQPKIFSKLFRAGNVLQKDTDGLGLGLYMTKSVIERGGGKISFVSEEGKGTTFSVELPVQQ